MDYNRYEPDYNDLAFEPEMTWKRLSSFAEEKGAYVMNDSSFMLNYLTYDTDGDIVFQQNDEVYFIARELSYQQMWNMIENLYN